MSENLKLQLKTQNQRGGKPGGKRRGLSPMSKRGRPQRSRHRWSLETTLELLEAMKVHVRANKLSCTGKNQWTAIACKLSNPQNLELERLARSSMVRITNIRRILSGDKRGNVEDEIGESLAEYLEICDLHQATKSSLSKKHLCSKRSSPSPKLTTPARGISLNRPSMTAKKLHFKDGYATIYTDEYSTSDIISDECVARLDRGFRNSQLERSSSTEAHGLPPAYGSESSSEVKSESSDSEVVVLRVTPAIFRGRRSGETSSMYARNSMRRSSCW